ncbi:MAG: type I-U CRISPR-associated helicase/endonuclease Cas3 [Verrucomicrobiota bacterium]|nr:type I-U CRISPR-associated helicase/endonuclease Cas3 [Verrucomicrobiota bacterium]
MTGNPPFPWQESLYEKFIQGEIPPAADLPTGMGKTSVVAIWLIALITHADKMPRRLVYVVNRRTVVDQTTAEVERVRKRLEEYPEWRNPLAKLCAIPADNPLAISTLRGQFADNREWCADPARPAVIVGTVDMIGSGLLFSRYTCGFKTRPHHAALLGQDVLLVHDEAHLEPAFQRLLIAIKNEQERCNEFREFHVMALSATSRQEQNPFSLTPEEKSPPNELPNPPTEPLHIVWQRLKAKKGLKLQPAVKRSEVAEQIARLALLRKASGKAVLIFVRTIDDVNRVRELLTDKKEGVPGDQVQVLTGTMRGWERDKLVKDDPAKGDPVFRRFLLKTPSDDRSTVYLICTSAGEVGIDISGDCMVCDLASLDSLTQRLGRVNRRGEGAAEIDVVYESDADPKLKDDDWEKARWKTLEIMQRLPQCEWIEGRHNASPLALRELNLKLSDEERTAAFAPEPICLPATDILFDAWAMTSIRDTLPGRPPIAPYLHGEPPEWELPETYVAWRDEVDFIKDGLLQYCQSEDLLADLLEDYPLKPHELLRDRSYRVREQLAQIWKRVAEKEPEAMVWIIEADGSVTPKPLSVFADKESDSLLFGRTILLPPSVGGLSDNGLFDGKMEKQDGLIYDVTSKDGENEDGTRRRVFSSDQKIPVELAGKFRLSRVIDRWRGSEENDDQPVPAEVRYWLWLEKRCTPTDKGGIRAPDQAVLLTDHTTDVQGHATEIVHKLALPESLSHCVVLAAQFHDLGKRRVVWQRRIGNPKPEVWYAKSGRDSATGKLWIPRDICRDYRHEFGSLRDAELEGAFKRLGADQRDLVLHLLAAHHGRARPHFPIEEADDPESTPADSEAIAIEVPRRFARLQRRFGRWGLAYLESLLRAADYAASAGILPKTTP